MRFFARSTLFIVGVVSVFSHVVSLVASNYVAQRSDSAIRDRDGFADWPNLAEFAI